MNRPKQAPRRQHRSLSQKLKTARLIAIYGKTIEEAALIQGITTRVARRELDCFKALAGVEKTTELTHWLHARGMGFCNDQTREDYLRIEQAWREAA